MALHILFGFAILGTLAYLFWPRGRLLKRRGSIYQRSFDELVTVAWDFGIFSHEITYVLTGGVYYVADSTHIGLAELGRKASAFEESRLDVLLSNDLLTMCVTRVLDDSNVLIQTASGARFDVTVDENNGWQFRHNGWPVESLHLTSRINREIRKHRSALVSTRSNRNGF